MVRVSIERSRREGSPFLVEDLEHILEELAPRAIAESWDNVGLLVGRRGVDVGKILVCLDLTETVVREAATDDFGTIVSHHPLLFQPLKRVTDADRRGVIVQQLIAADLAYFALHTNLDGAPGGLSELVAKELGVMDVQPLVHAQTGWKKLVSFLPGEAVDKVTRAVYAAGAGQIGHYRECGFELPGQGTFLPTDKAQPYAGKPGRRERVEEVRWETVVPAARLSAAIQALLANHPYEEPAFDIYPLEDVAARAGQGRVGRLLTRLSLAGLAETAAETFGLREVSYAGQAERPVDRVAVVPGSGGSLMEEAARVADVLVTGDLRYHDAERAEDLGLGLVVVPHGHLEAWAMRSWTRSLRAALRGRDCEVHFTTTARSPWHKAHPLSPGTRETAVARLFDAREMAGELATAEEGGPRPEPGGGEEEESLFLLRIDGGSRGNPGPSAIGVVLEDDQGNIVEQIGARIGHATNNVAEYQALLTGLETALDRGVERLRIVSDSELLVRQLRQDYKVKSEALRELFLAARSLIKQFDRVEIVHVPREENAAADALVNAALEGKL